jgi:putative transposase
MESDTCVVEMMKKVRGEHRPWGFRLIYAHLRLQDQKIGRRRAFRLYQKSRMSLHRTPKRPRIKREYLDLLPPKNINEGWAMDFLSEWIIGTPQQSVRVINVVDECSRKNLWVEAAQSINATKLSDILDKIILMRGKPKYIRCDNGPEFISQHLKDWAGKNVIDLKFIQPGKPTQNGIIERLNGTLRKECLNLNWFNSLDELNDDLDIWFKAYNFDRPHSSLKYLTPNAFEIQNPNLYLKVVPV